MTEHALWRSVEVRVAAEARTLDALLVPYDEVTYDVPDPRGERFARGAFAEFITDWAAAEGKRSRRPVPFFRNHQHDRAAGVARSLAETPDGPVGSFRIPDTPFGNEVLAEYREGLLDGISVGFYALEETRDDEGVRVITKARLVEASAVVLGAYQSARVLAVRSKQAPRLSLPKAPRIDPHGWLA